MSDPRLVPLEALEQRLRELVSLLSTPAERSDDAAMHAGWLRCHEAFERFRDLEGPDPADDLRAHMENAQRLHAVAMGLATRARDELRGELATLGETRQRLRQVHGHVTGSHRAGGSCDVSG